jgi:hypothetical protein
MQYKENDLLIDKDGNVNQIEELIKQTDSNIKYINQDGDEIIVALDFIELATLKYEQMLEESEKDLKEGEVVQVQKDNGSWVPNIFNDKIFSYTFVCDLPEIADKNHIVLKKKKYSEDEYMAANKVRRFNKELTLLERSMCL